MRKPIIIIFIILFAILTIYGQEQPVYSAFGSVKKNSVLTYSWDTKAKKCTDSSVYIFNKNNKLIEARLNNYRDSISTIETYNYNYDNFSFLRNITFPRHRIYLPTDTIKYWHQYESLNKIRYVTSGNSFILNYYYVPSSYYWENGNLPNTILRYATENKICDTNGVIIGEFNFHVSGVGFHQCIKYDYGINGKIESLYSKLVTDTSKLNKLQIQNLKREIKWREGVYNFSKKYAYDILGNVISITECGNNNDYLIITKFNYKLDKNKNWILKKGKVLNKTYQNGKLRRAKKYRTIQKRKIEYF